MTDHPVKEKKRYKIITMRVVESTQNLSHATRQNFHSVRASYNKSKN